MLSASSIVDILHRESVTDVVGVPDNSSAALYTLLERDAAIAVRPVTREGEAFSLACGLWMGGRHPVLLIQNTGLLESGDAFRGTAMRMRIPLVCLVTYRGYAKMMKLFGQAPARARRGDAEPVGGRLGRPGDRADPAGLGPPLRLRPRRGGPAPAGGRLRAGPAAPGPVAALITGDTAMMTKDQALAPLAAARTDRWSSPPWAWCAPGPPTRPTRSTSPPPTAPWGTPPTWRSGIALARPERKVICLNGDGSMLMTLGTLVTAVANGARNLVLVRDPERHLRDHGQPAHPGRPAGRLRGPGPGGRVSRRPRLHRSARYAAELPPILAAPGPILVCLQVEPGRETPLGRQGKETAAYLQLSAPDEARRFRQAVGGG